jgi:hypothetical protein
MEIPGQISAEIDTQAFLDSVRLLDLQDAATWRQLTTLVQILPDADIFPVRARYAARIKERPPPRTCRLLA